MSKLAILPEGEATTNCRPKPALHVTQGAEGGVGARQFKGRAAVITLGCAKNHVDSEVMLGVLRAKGFEIVSQVTDADVAIVNTCGFLQSAVEESIDCILDVAELKRTGRLRKLVVAGCAVERYRDPSGKHQSMQEALPEVDAFISVNEVLSVADVAVIDKSDSVIADRPAGVSSVPFAELLGDAARPYFLYDDSMPRELATRNHFAYVKVSEGCNRPCTFCIIPKIRGQMRSRSIDSVLREVEDLRARGVREINLVAQDLTSFGLDLPADRYGSGRRLVALLEALDRQASIDWIRLLYAYPVGTDRALLEAIRDLPRVVEYLDIPLQHASERILTRMKRPIGSFAPRRMVQWMKEVAPQVAIRTTFIVGFPGETEEDLAELEAFVAEGHFSSVGVFTYSQESGTPAGEMDEQISEVEKRERRDRIMAAQQGVVQRYLNGYLGKRLPVLVEGLHEDTEALLVGRARFQAPEVDGTVIVNDLGAIDFVEPSVVERLIGTLREVEITEVAGYDLVGRLVGDPSDHSLSNNSEARCVYRGAV